LCWSDKVQGTKGPVGTKPKSPDEVKKNKFRQSLSIKTNTICIQ